MGQRFGHNGVHFGEELLDVGVEQEHSVVEQFLARIGSDHCPASSKECRAVPSQALMA
ncbi:hypothetical protein [Nocardia cyriacigeorgica]|uniref:hypothetical protein n=1 Tax=Nocardia cyriacigeorgica TaxID=135487 RepID=UPI000304114C|nr:hypothetical protein [Nocardia cyriacigeorgica]